MQPKATPKPLNEIIANRAEKLERIKGSGINPYPNEFAETTMAGEAAREENLSKKVKVKGRLLTRRQMGKATFANIHDSSGKIQLYVKKDAVGEESYKNFVNNVDIGDIIGIEGSIFKTKTNEITVQVDKWMLLSKALRPPPEKFHGMTDVESRYRRREVDLFSNDTSKQRFLSRRKIIKAIQKTLDELCFVEVETPMMQHIPGGAAAKPFITKHEALDINLYMRIAPELYLKRLIVGGLEKVYEIGRVFRNEGIDTRHNPEFTILEVYEAYTNYEGMRFLTEKIIRAAAENVYSPKSEKIDAETGFKLKEFSLYPETYPDKHFPWLSLEELFKEHAGLNYMDLCKADNWHEAAKEAGVNVDKKTPEHKCFEAIVDEKIIPKLPDVAFIYGYPAAFSPLAKCYPDNPHVAERFEMFIAGEEIANAYSEQNDPQVQKKHFQEQARQRKAGDAEAMPADEEFLTALEYGMPPAGGLGIGVDRLTMILTGTESIREVILFPILRPEKS